MLRFTAVGDLRPGMFIIIPRKWIDHPFLRTKFLIASQEQIEKLQRTGVTEVVVDLERSFGLSGPESSHGAPPDVGSSGRWPAEDLVPHRLRQVIRQPGLSHQERADVVYECSLAVARNFLEAPTPETIRDAKHAVYEIVDLILADAETADCLLRITSHDFYTYTHSVNVGVLSILLAKEALRDPGQARMRELGAAFFLHDLGKTCVPPEIINKPGPLDEREMETMRTHPHHGCRILEEAGQLSPECAVIVMQHHERADGSGYPRRLKGEEIHVFGRICCVADVFDALTSERAYKKAMSPFAAAALMKEQMIHCFTPALFEHLVRLLARGRETEPQRAPVGTIVA